MKTNHRATQGSTRGARHGRRGHGGSFAAGLSQGLRGGLGALAVCFTLSACGPKEPPPPLVPFSKVDMDAPSSSAPPPSPRAAEEPARPEAEAAAVAPTTSVVGEGAVEPRVAGELRAGEGAASERAPGGRADDAPGRAAECNRLRRVIDAEEEKSAKIVPAGGGTNLGDLEPAAKALDGSAKAVGDVELTVPELVRIRKGLVEVYKDLASATRTVQGSLRGGNADKALAAIEQVKRGQAAQSQRMGELNAYCKGP